MKKALSSIEKKYIITSEHQQQQQNSIRNEEKSRKSIQNNNNKQNQVPTAPSRIFSENEIDDFSNLKIKHDNIKDYHNKLSLDRINFSYEEYGVYPDEQFQPSVYFFKFLCIKPDYEEETKRQFKKLVLNIPDTIVMNDSDVNFWIYTDEYGQVKRTDSFNDMDVIDKFCKFEKETVNKDKQIVGVFKSPIYKGNLLEKNHLEVLNQEELEKHMFSKALTPSVLQRYVKCRGPKAFLCRSVYRNNKPPYVYIFTNKHGYSENLLNQNTKFLINSTVTDSYYLFYSNSGKHLEETSFYMKNIVKYIERHTDLIIDELVCDFIKDEVGIWWMINCKALKIKNINKYIDSNGTLTSFPDLEKFCNRRGGRHNDDKLKKFDYQTKLKCKFCGTLFGKVNLKYNLTTKMILETDKQLKHLNIILNYIDRPDLSHTDSSMLYLPHRVCEDCYLLFETMNDIKKYQIKIANYFRINVDDINFGVDYYIKPKQDIFENIGVNQKLEKEFNIKKTIYLETMRNNMINDSNLGGSIKKEKYLYRILILFSDLFWNEEVEVPNKEFYLLFNFLNLHIKAKVKRHYKELDYFNINFFKIFYVICDPDEGFIDYIDKNRSMQVKLGWFEDVEKGKEKEKEEKKEILKNNIIIEDQDICKNYENFIQFASVELSIQGLKYGEKYRNSLNGLLFKEQKPHFTGKLRCTIRINKEKPIDVEKINCRRHMNFYIPPVHFVTPEELPDYWLELIERQKLRESILDSILNTIDKRYEKFDKKQNKEEIFQTLESLISQYLTREK